MLFNSWQFAIFLPIVFFLYWAFPHKYRWVLLLGASYYFYMSWNPKYVILIMATTLVSFLAGIAIEKSSDAKKRKIMLVGTIVFCLGILFFFKYFNFLNESIVNFLALFAIELHPITLNVLLPVGISFYTFQTMSYVIDVYKGKVDAEHNIGVYATFISFFPQLVAGPIERTSHLLPQITSEKKFDYGTAMYGARRILWGLFKKIAVADVIAVYVDQAYNNLTSNTPLDSCIAIFFFTIQIYCDFSGYSDIALGTAKLFGIDLMDNFKSPYFALSIREFWSRWHISLSTWFRDYVYIPLGGNRCSKLRNYFNLMVTFILSGLWHGANWTFVIWGGLHGGGQIIEKAIGYKVKPKSRVKSVFIWALVFAFCNIAWVFFRAENISDAVFMIVNAFSGLDNPESYLHTTIGLTKRRLLFSLITILMVAVYDYLSLKTDLIRKAENMNRVLVIGVEYIVLGAIVMAVLFSTGSNQFVYFQF